MPVLEMPRAKSALGLLSTGRPGIYQAASPGYPSNFSCDSLTYGFPELTDPAHGFVGAGNHTQSWSVGAYQYFERLKIKPELEAQSVPQGE